MNKKGFARYIVFSCLLVIINMKLVSALETQIVCGSQYIASLVESVTGGEIQTLLLVNNKEDPFKVQSLDEEKKNRIKVSKMVIVHKYQKALLHEVKANKGKKTSVVVLNEMDLILPLNYLKAALKLKVDISKVFPELDIYMDENIIELKEQVSLLNGKLLAKARDLGFNNILCIVSERQKIFVEWLGLDVIQSFKDDKVFSVDEKNKLLKKAKQKECWLVICNEQGGSKTVAKEWIEFLDGEMLVLADNPEANEAVGSPGWKNLLEDNVKRLINTIVWH